jgi:hypothetical protein
MKFLRLIRFTYLIRPKVSIPSRGSGKGDANPRYGWSSARSIRVSIPSRGSGKGDRTGYGRYTGQPRVSIPSRGSDKGDSSAREPYPERVSSLKSTHLFLPVNKTVKPAISSVACKP